MDHQNNDLIYKIALTKIPGIGSVTAKLLLGRFGNAKEVFAQSKKELIQIDSIGELTAESILSSNPYQVAENTLKKLEQNPQVKALFYTDPEYPNRLKHHDGSPLILFTEGNADFNAARTVGIIGTRNCNEYGILQCEKLVDGLKKYNVQVVSGLAYGIDACAHRRAVKAGLSNLAILGSGIDVIYPSSHLSLAKKIKSNGAIMSQFDFGRGPDRQNFPTRNQVVAALCDAIVVVQSKKSGGSLITAEFANNMNKDVFAVPGRVSDEVSEGCNNLIKQHKANLLQSAKDIGYIMRWEPQETIDAQMKLFDELNEKERKIVDTLIGKEPVDIDTLHFMLKQPLSQISSLLLDLEFRGIVKSLPGKRYTLL